METKRWFESKTLWANMLIAPVAFYAQYKYGWIMSSEIETGIYMAINVILRLITKSPISVS